MQGDGAAVVTVAIADDGVGTVLLDGQPRKPAGNSSELDRVALLEVGDGVVPVPCVEHEAVGIAAACQRVVAVAAVQRVGTVAAHQNVIAVAAIQRVGTAAEPIVTVKFVVSVTTLNGIGAQSAIKFVIAALAIKRVVALAAFKAVVAVAAVKVVLAVIPVEAVVA